MTQTNTSEDHIFSTSKFYMWRCVTAMAHADGMVHEAEETYLNRIFLNMRERVGMPEEYYETLCSDLSTPQNVEDFLPHINDPVYRGQVVYFARLLAFKDGEMHPSEEQLLAKLHAVVTEGLDMEAIRKTVHENVQKELVLQEIESDATRPTTGLIGLVYFLLVHFGIDLMDE